MRAGAKPTKAAARHMTRIAAMRCICCHLLHRQQQSQTEVHHIREGRQERSDMLTLPLCGHDCHRGPSGVHGDKRWLTMLKMGEFDLLSAVLEQLEPA